VCLLMAGGGRFVRSSSYRHVFGTPAKEVFSGLRPTFTETTDGLCANTKYFGLPYSGGGGPVLIWRLDRRERMGAKVPFLAVHKAQVLDMCFHPFIETLVITGDDLGRICLSRFPDGGLTEDIVEPVASFEGHSKKITALAPNPIANNILASGSADNCVRIWDLDRPEALFADNPEEVHNDAPLSLQWNRNGSLLLVSGKDKKVRIFDPRDAKTTQHFNGLGGTKKSSYLWADNHGYIIGVGANARSTRQYALYDPRELSAPISTSDIDQSSSAFVAHFDGDNSILWLAGKGDATIRYYEVTKDGKGAVYALSEFRDNTSQKGLCFLPKRACDVSKCEIASVLRLMGDQVIPVSFQVPRKSDLFQKDLYPDAYAGLPAETAQDWRDGKNADPILASLKPGAAAPAAGAAAAAAPSAKKSYAELEAEIEQLKKRIAELEGAK